MRKKQEGGFSYPPKLWADRKVRPPIFLRPVTWEVERVQGSGFRKFMEKRTMILAILPLRRFWYSAIMKLLSPEP